MAGMPGPGFAAGPCLVKDTMQLAAFSHNHFMLGHSAMLVNEGLPNHLLEMARRDLALHYQLHAVTPLVVTAALLNDAKPDLFDACDGAIHRAVDFVVAAFDDPKLAEGIAGRKQSYFDGSEKLRAFELAWAEAYLSLFDDAELRAFVESYGDLGNSKLGGRQSILWGI